jgi:hypothetical protein
MTSVIYLVGDMQCNGQDNKLTLLNNICSCVQRNNICIVQDINTIVERVCCGLCEKKYNKNYMKNRIYEYLIKKCKNVYVDDKIVTFVHNSKIIVGLGSYPNDKMLKHLKSIIDVTENKLPYILFWNYSFNDQRWTMDEKNKLINFIENNSMNVCAIFTNSHTNTTSIQTLDTNTLSIPVISACAPDHFLIITIEHNKITLIQRVY